MQTLGLHLIWNMAAKRLLVRELTNYFVFEELELPVPPLEGRFESGTPGCPGKPFVPGAVDEAVPGTALADSLIFVLELPELVLFDIAPEEPELEDLPVLMLPQAARARTHAIGMIQFFMKNSLKERKTT